MAVRQHLSINTVLLICSLSFVCLIGAVDSCNAKFLLLETNTQHASMKAEQCWRCCPLSNYAVDHCLVRAAPSVSIRSTQRYSTWNFQIGIPFAKCSAPDTRFLALWLVGFMAQVPSEYSST